MVMNALVVLRLFKFIVLCKIRNFWLLILLKSEISQIINKVLSIIKLRTFFFHISYEIEDMEKVDKLEQFV